MDALNYYMECVVGENTSVGKYSEDIAGKKIVLVSNSVSLCGLSPSVAADKATGVNGNNGYYRYHFLATGKPTQTGDFVYTIKAGSGSVLINFYVKVKEKDPTITTNTLPICSENIVYYMQLQATGTTPITWSIIDGELPQGLTLDSETGVISGTPILD